MKHEKVNFVTSNKVCLIVQVEWPTYSIPTIKIALISDFTYVLGVTRAQRGYEPPFIPRLGTLHESMGIKDVSLTVFDTQMAIMAQIKKDRRKTQTASTVVPTTSCRGSEITTGTSGKPPRASPPQPPPPHRQNAIEEYLGVFEEDNAQSTSATSSRARKELVRCGSNQRSRRTTRGH